MNRRPDSEQRLLADVLQDAAHAAMRDAVKVRCAEEMRSRREGETTLLDTLAGNGLGHTAWRARLARAGSSAREPGTRLRRRSPSSLDDEGAFLESVREEALSALRRRRVLPLWCRLAAAAAAVAVCVGASVLLRRSPDPATLIAEADPAAETGHPGTPDLPPAYLVVSRPPSEGMIVRTGAHESKVEIIGDDELLDAIPGLAITRVGSPGDDRMVFVKGPGLGQAVRVN